jgi:hypothetical protein
MASALEAFYWHRLTLPLKRTLEHNCDHSHPVPPRLRRESHYRFFPVSISTTRSKSLSAP